MTSSGVALPAGFESLEPFTAKWAVDLASEPTAVRAGSTAEVRKVFYEAAVRILPQALACLYGRPLDSFESAEKRLMKLMLGLAHVSMAVEVQGSAEAKHADDARHLAITHAPSDWPGHRAGQL